MAKNKFDINIRVAEQTTGFKKTILNAHTEIYTFLMFSRFIGG